ncbi:(deoxy)nucleoside triphosphate pyrophosphohydrolase [Flavobacterium ardleyense]|uniref:(deoxy)nucleoside triphosphate pyrophosphohydrolase n=1 Tax=Flavobacterium ardleyense TaxID=2038737 RepID=UPI00298D1060|nr:(deoxy)nucleoside triphosphate pyrophosphohydrolase [Flavobacterium ardleyense]
MINVTCAIIYFGSKIIVTQRSKEMKLPLKWEFPGGKLEIGESEESCIKREIKEEINIKIEILSKLTNTIHDYGEFQVNLIPFIARHISGDIMLTEHHTYKLLDPAELLHLDWAEADLPIVEELLKIKL